jgi:hypothetical protein
MYIYGKKNNNIENNPSDKSHDRINKFKKNCEKYYNGK